MPTRLPFPAEEIRQAALDAIHSCQEDVGRLIHFHRGHHKDCSTLTHIQVSLLSLAMTLSHLKWPSTDAELPFDAPAPKPPPTPGPARS